VNEIIGDFTTSLPLAVNNSSAGSFETRAERIQTQLLEDIEHRFVSGVQIIRDLALAQGRNPEAAMPIVFTSLLSQNGGKRAADKTLWMGDVVYGISQTPQVWLDHQVLEENGALVFNWDSVEDLFPEKFLEDMFDSYYSLLHRLSASKGAWLEPVGDLLPPAQLHQRAEINSTEVPLSPATLHGLFESQAKLRMRDLAVVAANGSLTYDELRRKSNHLGRMLRRMGSHPNSLVAVVMDKGWEQIAAVLGVLKAGAAYVPIDPSLPKERLWHLFDHAGVGIVLTQLRVDERVEWPADVRRILVDLEDEDPCDKDQLQDLQSPGDLAYVVYTSGSTGLPKGVMISHSAAVNTIVDVNRRFNVRAGDRVFAISSLGFDLSVYDVFGTLAAGATIVLPDPGATRDPATWVDLIKREKVTIWNSVPALMEMLVAHNSERDTDLTESLRLVLLSGDWIPVTLPDRIRRISPGALVISLGGATEAAIWSILFPISNIPSDLASIPYGRPMANQHFHVLDEALQPRATWVPGDLYISGVGLALGYWRDEERTNASFITRPRTGERLYRTGDLGRYLPDGNIEFLGREDFQVKIQGHRIEIGEIEATLLKHPNVRSAAVVAAGPREGRRLVAYVAGNNHCPVLTSDVLARFLKAKLPAYMVPASFVILDSLPLTANGKVDRTALADLIPKPEKHCEGPLKLQQPIERVINATIAGVLNLDYLDPDSSLLELGANSIDIIRIGAILEKELKVPPRLEEFYVNPTLKSLYSSYHERLLCDRGPDDGSMRAHRQARFSRLACEEGEL
jgi:amino acid adenylation domain-containing protein